MQFFKKNRLSLFDHMKKLFPFCDTKILSRTHGTKFFLAVFVILFASCKKESDIGFDVQPEGDLIGLFTTDSTTLLTYTVREDSLRTDETPSVVIGKYNDVIFGGSTSGVFSQFVIPSNLQNINFTAGAVLDSAVLMLAYKFDYYGDTLVPQTFDVYQMTDMIYKDSLYYSNRPKSFYPGAIGSLTFNPHPNSKTIVGTDTLPAHIRIPIDMTWAQLVFDQSGGNNLSSNTNWLAYMNGLHITPSGNAGGMLYFNMLDTLTGLRLYYHTATDTTDFTFVVNSSAAYYSYFQHDYTTANLDIQTQLLNPGVEALNYTYVQSNSGLKTRIEFPFLDNYKNLGYPIAINKAELVVTGDANSASDDFPLNTRMFLTSIDSLGKERLLVDMFESSTYYGGSLNTTTNEYKINIARYIQGVLKGEEENNGLYLKEIFGTENGRRSVIGCGNSQSQPPRMYLRLIYTRIN